MERSFEVGRESGEVFWVVEGLGVRCPEAQADGFPCPDPGCRCETCEMAVWPRPPGGSAGHA